jgi:hypothetical protein
MRSDELLLADMLASGQAILDYLHRWENLRDVQGLDMVEGAILWDFTVM